MEVNNLEAIMGLILNGGDAKNHALDAIKAAKAGDFNLAKEKMEDASKALVKAHKSQSEMLYKEANGKGDKLNLLMVHAQDHLMTSICFIDLAKEIIEVYEKIEKGA